MKKNMTEKKTRNTFNILAVDLDTGQEEWFFGCPIESITVAALFDHLEASRNIMIKYAVRLPSMTPEEIDDGDTFRVH